MEILRIRKLSISVCKLKSSIHILIYGKIKKKREELKYYLYYYMRREKNGQKY